MDLKKFKDIIYFIKEDKRLYIFYNIFTDKIIISSGLLNVLNKFELRSLLYHETQHRKDRKIYIIIYLLFLIIVIKSIFNIVLNSVNSLSLISLFISATILILLDIIYKFMEFRADDFAATNINPNYLIQALPKLKKKENNYNPFLYYLIEKITHPALEKRIDKLKNKKPY